MDSDYTFEHRNVDLLGDSDDANDSRMLFKCVYPRRIDAELLNLLPIVSYKGEITLVENDAQLDAELPKILRERVLGFDTETRPNFTKNKHYLVSLLQLCGEEKVWIIRLEPLKNRLCDIYEIFENPSIKKVGLAVHGDILSLKERWLFSPAGFVDISKSTRNIGVINTGMRNLAALILGERISKSAQLTNWASPKLTPKQLEYAATDAWISRRLFLELKKALETTCIAIEPEEKVPHKFDLGSFVSNMIGKFAKGAKKVLPMKKLALKIVRTKSPDSKADVEKSDGGRRKSGDGRRRPQQARNSNQKCGGDGNVERKGQVRRKSRKDSSGGGA